MAVITKEGSKCVTDVEKLAFSYIAGGDVKWCNHSGKQLEFLQALNVRLLYDPETILPGAYPKEMKTCDQKKPEHKCS